MIHKTDHQVRSLFSRTTNSILILSIAISFLTLAMHCSQEEGGITSTQQIAGLIILQTAWSGCSATHSFTSGETLSDPSDDPRIGIGHYPPSSFSFDDITSGQATQGGNFVVNIGLKSIPSTLRINKSELSGQSGNEYQWAAYFEGGGVTYTIAQVHPLGSTESTVAFGSENVVGVFQGSTSLGNCGFPGISGDTMTFTCNTGSITQLANIDSSFSWYIYTINKTSDGDVKDCM